MKASEVTEAGFYWYDDDGQWVVVKAFKYGNGCRFVFAGNECDQTADHMDGDFAGPIVPPTT